MSRYRHPKRRIRWDRSDDDDWQPYDDIDEAVIVEPVLKRKKPDHQDFTANSINDLIKLGFLYDSTINNSNLLQKLFQLIPSLMKLDSMIGMESIKKQLTDQIIYFIQGYHENDLDGNFINTVLLGSPGTGKTEVSYILAGIYKSLGFLSTDKVTLAKKSDFIANYLGQTVNKTQKTLEKAKGGVLVIDEVYAFGSRDSESNADSYGKEAVDTINQYLSENRKDIVCIVIGYKKDVEECFFSLNKGLKRRFPFTYEIEDYTPLELKDIFIYQVRKNNWNILNTESIDIQAFLTESFRIHKTHFKNNGGSTEEIFFKCKMTQSKKMFGKEPNLVEKYSLSLDVIKETFEEYIKIKDKNKLELLSSPPPGMYG